jgi:hypothetical protein
MKWLILAFCLTASVAQADTFERGIDRPGSDYTHFNGSSARACQAECRDARRCRAWTFVRAGFQGDAPKCWLKDRVPASTEGECCTSGVVR